MIDLLDIGLHSVLLACAPLLLLGTWYLRAREHKQHPRGLTPQSRREWLWPAIFCWTAWLAVLAWAWVTA